MKLAKFALTLTAVATLAACHSTMPAKSTMTEKANQQIDTQSEVTFKTAGYFCSVSGKKKVVSATYTFIKEQPDSVTLSIDGAVVGDLAFDPSYQDGTRFVAGQRIWSLEQGFSQNTVEKTVPVMYVSKNRIVAKYCEIASK